MRIFHALSARLAQLSRSRAEVRMEEEFRFHVDMETDANVKRGLPPAEARRLALVAFGGVDRQRERMREGRAGHAVELAMRDLRHAMRALLKAPTYVAAVVLTLGVGIGAVTALFTVTDRILIRPLPYPDSDRLVDVEHAASGLGLERIGVSSGTYLHYRSRAPSLAALAVFQEAVVNVSGGTVAADRIALAMVSPEFFQVLGVSPALGRAFTPEEVATQDGLDMTGLLPVLVSHDLWRQRFGADPGVLGRTIDINSRARRVVGVMPPGFAFPRASTQVWMLAVVPEHTANLALDFDYEAVARLRPGVAIKDAEAELAGALSGVEGAFPDATPQRLADVGLEPHLTPLKRRIVGRVEVALWVLLGSMALLLVTACANVANLTLARSQQRLPEMSIRLALGGGRVGVTRVYLSESLLLGGGGAALGLILAAVGVGLFVRLAPEDLPRLGEVRMNLTTFGLASLLGLGTALVVGLIPTLRHAGSLDVASSLRASARGVSGDREGRRFRSALVAAQVGLAFTLLMGSSLASRSFTQLMRIDPGFDPEGVLVVEMGLPGNRAARHQEIFGALMDRVRGLPGVSAAAGVSDVPLSETVWTSALEAPLHVDGRDPSEASRRPVRIHFFMPGYFQVMRTPILEGASLAPGDSPEVPNPVVISATLARHLFPEGGAVGRRIRRLQPSGEEITYVRPGSQVRAPQPDYVVVGVAADVHATSLREGPTEIVYIPVIDPRVDPGFVPTEMSLLVRTNVPPLELAPAVAEIVREVDPVLGLARVRTLDQVVGASVARERFLAVLLRIAGAAALLLGTIGVYGVVSYTVRQRSREVGIRVALGGRPKDVVRGVLLGALPMVFAGAAAGVVVSILSMRVLDSLLFGIRPGDAVSFAAVGVLVIGVSTVAIWIPARRCSRTDPVDALRAE